ncbi:AAA family ATPase [Agromyces mediolanus]|uniref:AAA family ATPase n=1 Tax=Agromyces mediolanus TaxID=41986 RepID=UPI0038384FF6
MFVGRARELERLRAVLDPMSGGAVHRVVFLEGAVGIGKTALLTEFLAEWDGARVLFARADEHGTTTPLGGILGILEQLFGTGPTALLERVRAPRELLRAIRERLGAQPALVVIDDAQWLDPAATTVLEELVMAPSPTGWGFLFAHQPGGMPGRLVRAARRGGCAMHRIVLDPLEPGAAGALLSSQGVLDLRLVELAGGNPLFLRLLAEHHHRTTARPVEAVRTSLDGALRRELEQLLTPRERTIAELVAEGHSNRDIAAALHLSPRTVETHVSRILRKTGVRSRAGLARRLDAAG